LTKLVEYATLVVETESLERVHIMIDKNTPQPHVSASFYTAELEKMYDDIKYQSLTNQPMQNIPTEYDGMTIAVGNDLLVNFGE